MAPGVSTLPAEDRVATKSVFSVLGPADFEYARLHARRRHMLAGTVLFLEGDPCAGLYLVQCGALRLFTGHAGKEQTLRVVRPGETCNEFAACGGGANPTSGQAIDDSDVLVLQSADVSYLLGRSNGFAHAVLATMADSARHFVALVGDLSFHHVTGRVAKVLLQSVAPAPGVGAGTGGRSLTQQELADLVGTAREVVARSLRTLCTAGALALVRDCIVIRDRHLLEEAAAESCGLATRTSSPVPYRPHVFGAPARLVTPVPQARTRGPSPRTASPEFAAGMAIAEPVQEKVPA